MHGFVHTVCYRTVLIMEDISTSHRRKSTGVIDKLMAELHSAASDLWS